MSFKNDTNFIFYSALQFSQIPYILEPFPSFFIYKWWRLNNRILRQAELDSTEIDGDDEGFSQLLWEALDVEDEFVGHLERQLKTITHLLPSPKTSPHYQQNE